jgi:hypothetical protein
MVASTNAIAATITRPEGAIKNSADKPVVLRSIPQSPVFNALKSNYNCNFPILYIELHPYHYAICA